MQGIVQQNFEAGWNLSLCWFGLSATMDQLNLDAFGWWGNWSPQKKHTQTGRKQSNLTQKGLLELGIKAMTALL